MTPEEHEAAKVAWGALAPDAASEPDCSPDANNRVLPEGRSPAAPDGLVHALRNWRTAEVHHGAIVLKIREGDEAEAEQCAQYMLQCLRVEADKFLRASKGNTAHSHDESEAMPPANV